MTPAPIAARRPRRPVEPIYSRVGRRIAEARIARGLTQAALGRRIGHSRLSMVGIENGYQRVQLHDLYAIARALRVDLGYLLAPGVTSSAPPADEPPPDDGRDVTS